jgi:hypothetical protein
MRLSSERMNGRRTALTSTRLLFLLGFALPVFAQYAGPALLTRGEIPKSMQPAQIDFRPYIELNGIYDTGLTGVSTDQYGNIPQSDGYGGEAAFGIYGVHRWKRTSVGLDYRGNVRHYTRSGFYDGSDHTISLGLTRQTTRHTSISIRESAGTFTRSFGLFAFGGRGTFDPTLGYLPANDFFDNRTDFLSSQADITYQKSARLSFNAGGDYFLVHYRSKALAGLTGGTARGDISYRTGVRSTIGLAYNYMRFRFSRSVGATDTHGLVGTYAVGLSRNLEFSLFGGVARAESQFVRQIGLDPAIAALLGRTTALALTTRADYVPQAGVRIIRSFRHSSFTLNGMHGITPGNGIFLTSSVTTGDAAYSYTGLRRWNVGMTASYSAARARSDLTGSYRTFSAGMGATRQIMRSTHLTFRYDARKYGSGQYKQYDRLTYRATVGIAFAPGDIPLSLW